MICRICLNSIQRSKHEYYHDACLKVLFGSTNVSPSLPYSRQEFMRLAPKRTNVYSISGVQPKLQASIIKNTIEVTDNGGDYIIKPCPEEFEFFPENELLCMRIHALFKIDTPPCGLVPFDDGSLAYIIKRFDRKNGHKTAHHEDMSSLLNLSSSDGNNKYVGASYQEVLEFIYQASKSQKSQIDFIKRLYLSYLLGNGDLHLKNISMTHLIDHIQGEIMELSPVYDVINTAIYGDGAFVMRLDFLKDDEPKDFLARGNGYYSHADFVELAVSVGLNKKPVDAFRKDIQKQAPKINDLVSASFLNSTYKESFKSTLNERLGLIL